MALKRAEFLSYGDDALCAQTMKYIEDSGIVLTVRDISVNPLTEDELRRMIGHIDVRHFLNSFSDAYTRLGLDQGLPPRLELFKLMAGDHTLIRRPIIRNTRLITVGCDKRRVSEMLQIQQNGQVREMEEPQGNIKRPHRRERATAR